MNKHLRRPLETRGTSALPREAAALGWANANDRRWWWLAFLATVGVLCPLFGRSITLFGIHSRIVSAGLMGWAGLMAAKHVPIRRIDKVTGVVMGFILVFVFAYSNAVQLENLLRPQFEMDYYEGKLGLFVQLAVPLQVIGLLCSGVKDREVFQRGVIAGMLACGAVAVAVFISDADDFLSQTFVMMHAFEDKQIFSTISMSILLSLTAIILLFNDRGRFASTALCWTAFAMLLAPILLLRQRAHMLMLGALLAVRLVGRRSVNVGQLLTVAAVAWAAFYLFQGYSAELLGETVNSYWDQVFSGELLDSRAPAYEAAMSMISRDPIGLGLGSFALSNPDYRYPHNVVLEASVELGVIGGFAVALLYAIAINRSVRQLLNHRASACQLIMASTVLFLVVHTLKAGDITGLGFLSYFVLVSPPDVRTAIRGAVVEPPRRRLIA